MKIMINHLALSIIYTTRRTTRRFIIIFHYQTIIIQIRVITLFINLFSAKYIIKSINMAILTLSQFGALFAGFLIMLVMGSLYVYGTMTPYILVYLYDRGQHDITISDLSIINTLAIICTNTGIFLSSFKILTFSNRITALISMLGICLCTLSLSFCEKFSLFVVIYGIFYGLFIGFGYLAPIKNCYDHLPTKKGLCTGTCMMGFGLGALVFNFILVYIVNPDDKKKQSSGRFPSQIGDNLPFALQMLSAVYAGIGLLGVLLVWPPKQKALTNESVQITTDSQEQIIKKQNHYSLKAIKYALQNKVGWLLAILASSVPYGLFIAFNFKQYGLIYGMGDHYLSLLGSLGSVGNGVFRMLLGVFLDYIAFKTIMIINLLVFLISCITMIFSVQNQASYLITIVVTYGCYGSLYSLFPTQTVRVLGRQIGPKMYYFTFIGFSFGSLMQYICHKFLVDQYGKDGYKYCFIIFGIFLAVSTFLVYKIQFKIHQAQTKLMKGSKSIQNEKESLLVQN